MSETAVPHIGTLREKPLHASLKRWYADAGDQIEVQVGGYVIDIVRDGLLIEIQTRSFSSIKRKLAALLVDGHRVRIVHPVARDRYIVRLEEDGTILGRRLSPKHGNPVDVFAELVYLSEVVSNPLLELDVVMTREDEYRVHTPGRSWRRNGWSVVERRLVEVEETVEVRSAQDLAAFVPPDLPDAFTTADLAAGLECQRRLAQQMAYCLKAAGAIRATGKRGNAVEYMRT